MGYHDRRPTRANSNNGVSFVNPLHKQRHRVTQLEQFLKEIAEETQDKSLRDKIDKILE
jgi:hypothetical protein